MLSVNTDIERQILETHHIIVNFIFNMKYSMLRNLSHPISSYGLLYILRLVCTGPACTYVYTTVYMHVHEWRGFTSFTRMACVESALRYFSFLPSCNVAGSNQPLCIGTIWIYISSKYSKLAIINYTGRWQKIYLYHSLE